MRNRPLLSVCLIILCVLASCTLVGKERFIKELRPSPLEICTTEDESVIVCGVIYRQEQKENGQMIGGPQTRATLLVSKPISFK